jgi:hypothetical protein
LTDQTTNQAGASGEAEGSLRSRLGTTLARWRHHEFWPAWLFYLPLVPWLTWLSLRTLRPLAFLACNPGIEKGGGFVNERKSAILAGLAHAGDALLDAVLIPAGKSPAERAALAAEAMASNPRLAEFPVILKPDAGQRGFAVKLAKSPADVLAYFEGMTAAALVQRYHPGPKECGVLWVRRGAPAARASGAGSGTPPNPNAEPGPVGFIFAVTRKEFPVVEGDGRRPLGRLIAEHPRLRCQAGVFKARHGHQWGRVLGSGERLRLAEAGNHCQGTLFRDGSDLVTPALSAAIDRILAGFPLDPADPSSARGGDRGGIDFGRFDLRYESDELLREGRGFGIVEFNGTSAEATNLYDPSRGLLWAYGVLFRQWGHLYRLGAARRRAGFPGFPLRALRAELKAHYRDRAGSSVAD